MKRNKKPLVSILMNCHNGEKFLKESLRSVILQTYKNWELVFWDNKSSDKSKKILKNFKDKRLKYYYTNRFNTLYKSRQLAIKKCKGDYIAFLDTDDVWLSNKLEKQINFILLKKYDFVYSNYYLKDLRNSKKKKYIVYKKLPEGNITSQLMRHYNIAILTVMIKKKILKKYKLNFNSNYNVIGDYDLFVKLSQKIYIGCIQQPLAIYRNHADSFSNQNLSMHINELKKWYIVNHKLFTLKNRINFKLDFYKLKIKSLIS